MEEKHTTHPLEVKNYDTERIREEYLVEGLFELNKIKTVYNYGDRMIIGGAYPQEMLSLEAIEILKSQYFLERREMGVVNIGGKGSIFVDGVEYILDTMDGLYIGMGAKDIKFASIQEDNLSKFYFISTLASTAYPITKISNKEVIGMELGNKESANERVLYKYIHPEGVKSCQLVMGITMLKSGSVWNSMPPHTHERRGEVYLYFNIPKDDIVIHFMGEPTQTRNIIVKNEECVISPYWSIHSGVGTKNYAFIWAMAGENQLFSDANSIELTSLR